MDECISDCWQSQKYWTTIKTIWLHAKWTSPTWQMGQMIQATYAEPPAEKAGRAT